MVEQLLLAMVLVGQCEERHILINTGPIYSKIYVRTIIEDGPSTEIPIINDIIPVVSVTKTVNGWELLMDYKYGWIYKYPSPLRLYRTEKCGCLPVPNNELPDSQSDRRPKPISNTPQLNDEPKPIPQPNCDDEILKELRQLNERVQRLEKVNHEPQTVKPIPSFKST